jgi:tryptophan 2,3-dioxygenase
MLEAALGLPYDQRFGQEYYISQLNTGDIGKVKQAEQEQSLLELVIQWLERMPIFEHNAWETDKKGSEHPFWVSFRDLYLSTLQSGEKENISRFDELFIQADKIEGRRLSNKANRHALFIMLYHDYPLLQLPFEIITVLLDIDALLGQWRSRHLNMVKRMIGSRTGTGGSSGAGYLKAAADSHYIFKEFAELTSFLIQRSKLPKLNEGVEKSLKFSI